MIYKNLHNSFKANLYVKSLRTICIFPGVYCEKFQ